MSFVEGSHRLHDDEKPYREYWFGEVIPKPTPDALHSAVQLALSMLLLARGWKALGEVRLRIVREAEPVPDIVASRNKIEQPYPTSAVEICVEILSPGDRLQETVRKAGYYLDWGFPCVWIVDPGARTAWIVTPEHRGGIWVHPDGALTAGDDLEIRLSEIFEEVDKLV